MKYESFEPNGSFFMLNENTMLGQGDCLELMKHIPDGSVDMVLTDPPYGTTACKWDSVIPFEPMWAELKRIIKPNGAIVLFGSEPFSSMLRCSNLKMFKYDWIWNKTKPQGFLNAKARPLIEHELYHIGVERDGEGEIVYSDNTGLPKHFLAGHDVEEFIGVVKRHGASENVKRLIEVAKQAPFVSDLSITRCCGTCVIS